MINVFGTLIAASHNYFLVVMQIALGHLFDIFAHRSREKERVPVGRHSGQDFLNAVLETHIEQGGILEKKKLQIGIVTGISNIVRYTVTAHGLANHGGTTPMEDRKDAMVAMAKLIVATDAACREIGHNLVFTPGKISCSPNAGNVVPETVICSFEMRNLEKKYTDALIEKVRETAAQIPEVNWDIELLLAKDSADCDSGLQKLIEEACQDAGATYQYMPSGAGHDAESLAHRIPVAMIFIPSHLGISHNGKEYTAPEFVERGGDILYRTLVKVDDER